MASSDPQAENRPPTSGVVDCASASLHGYDAWQQVQSGAAERGALPAAPGLSLVIPAYNELERLPPYLESIRRYLDREYPDGYEVIVVDDGSADGLAEWLAARAESWAQLRTIRHERNRGKGAAVRTGVLAACGARRLFADADGATPIAEEAKLRAVLDAGVDVAVGSRYAPPADADVVRHRTWRRAVIGRLFAACARWIISVPVTDTQCGFKMFRAAAGQRVFAQSQENGYLFDIEILVMARQLGYRIQEVPINWSDQPGSRLVMRTQWRTIMMELWRVRRRLARVTRA